MRRRDGKGSAFVSSVGELRVEVGGGEEAARRRLGDSAGRERVFEGAGEPWGRRQVAGDKAVAVRSRLRERLREELVFLRQLL
jgi:hypothetical protein